METDGPAVTGTRSESTKRELEVEEPSGARGPKAPKSGGEGQASGSREGTREGVRVPMDADERRAMKRAAESPPNDPRLDTPADLEDLVEPPDAAMQPEAQLGPGESSSSASGAQLPLSALELVGAEELAASKARLLALVEGQVERHYRAEGYDDISSAEVLELAALGLQLGAVDLAEVYSPERFTARCSEF